MVVEDGALFENIRNMKIFEYTITKMYVYAKRFQIATIN